jgi:hypothetical protein
MFFEGIMKQTLLPIFFIFILSSCSNPNINNQTYDKTDTVEDINTSVNEKDDTSEESDSDKEDISLIIKLSTADSSGEMEEERDEDKRDTIDEKIVCQFKPEFYFNHDNNIPKTHLVCQVYIDALNTYPLIDFFEAPMQLDTAIFSYPKWERLDIYDFKDIFLRTEKYCNDGYYVDYETFIERKPALEIQYYIKSDSLEEDKEADKLRWQMYYTRADIDNNGKLEDIIKKNTNRYSSIYGIYDSDLGIFENPKKSFRDINMDLGIKLNFAYIHSFFFYRDRSYMKKILYVPIQNFNYMLIQEFDGKKS